METRQQLTNAQRLRDFVYHKVNEETAEKMAKVRHAYNTLADQLLSDLPECREKSLALTHLEESSMRAIQSLATTFGEPIPLTNPT